MNKILLIDDDKDILGVNEKYLSAKGYSVQTADSGDAAMKALLESVFHCIVLDVLLPDVLGFDLCGKIREISDAPIIFLSCKDGEDDKVSGLSSGGDDYMTKPFSMRELEARISAQIRRTSKSTGGISFHKDTRIVSYQQRNVLLSQTEFEICQLLHANRHRMTSSQELYAALNAGKRDDSNTIAVYIRRLRKKFEAYGEAFRIETVRSEGYRLFID